jgi:hypothetical protein
MSYHKVLDIDIMNCFALSPKRGKRNKENNGIMFTAMPHTGRGPVLA